jgi:SAM-dependent methyltransferase
MQFANYARYYDLLYRDKDYIGETKFIEQLLQAHAPGTQSVLELGCGTGIHASLLAKSGYQVCGVDLSTEMLEKAEERSRLLPPGVEVKFTLGDVRTVRVEQKFDAVLSLFHVISYQVTNEDLQAAFKTAKAHLQPGGVFIFDCWYGPTVLSDPPAVRVKRLSDESISVTRIAEPVMYPNDNLVDVNYQIFIKNSQDEIAEVQETHKMRYLFKPEIDALATQNEFEVLKFGEWMTNKAAGLDTWGVYFVVKSL